MQRPQLRHSPTAKRKQVYRKAHTICLTAACDTQPGGQTDTTAKFVWRQNPTGRQCCDAEQQCNEGRVAQRYSDNG